MESEHLEKLKKLTPRLNELVLNKDNPKKGNPKGFIEYKVKEGTCLGFPLYKIEEIGIQRAFLTKDAGFPIHIHDNEIEILVIYKGRGIARIYNDDGTLKEEKTLEIGDCIRIPMAVPHSWDMLEDTWLIGITIPTSEDYPDA